MQGMLSGVLLIAALMAVAVVAGFVGFKLYRASAPGRRTGLPDA